MARGNRDTGPVIPNRMIPRRKAHLCDQVPLSMLIPEKTHALAASVGPLGQDLRGAPRCLEGVDAN
jgi:hypothetical protein